METRQLGAKHIKRLLDLLDKHREGFFEIEPEQRPQRLYFVDSDVLSVYINGRVRDPKSQWASLFSLVGESKEKFTPSTEADALTQAVGQSITRFLFGQFNLQLGAQQKHYYMTAEHEREVRAIISSVLQQARTPSEGWQIRLQNEYLKFCGEPLEPQEAQAAAENIMHTLVDQSPLGMVPRAHAVDHDFISILSTNLIRPMLGDGSSFIFTESDPHHAEVVGQLKTAFFEVFLKELGQHHSRAEKFFPLKRKVFDMHGPRIPLRHYAEAVCKDEKIIQLGTRLEIDEQVWIATAEANDVTSLARLASMADFLNNRHPLQKERGWEVCLISGSAKIRDLLSALEATDFNVLIKDRVRIVHPLCFLRHPELYDPDGVKALEHRGEGKYQDEEYALTQIFGHSAHDRYDIEDDKSCAFVQSLTRTLHGVVAREARKNDRALRAFWGKLELDANYNSLALMENVRSYIAYRFTDTLFKLTEMVPGERHTLSHVSVPTLDLRHSNAALRLLKSIRDSANEGKCDNEEISNLSCLPNNNKPNLDDVSFSSAEFQEVLEDDPTGYGAMLCAAMGFVVRGNDWLHLAQVMASTAVMFALGSRDETSYPQGNEALYLRTFISRISWSHTKRIGGFSLNKLQPEERIDSWLENQLKSLNMARLALDNWCQTDKQGAAELIPGLDKNRYDLIKLRYAVEELANTSFALQWKYFLNADQKQSKLFETNLPHPDTLVLLEKACGHITTFCLEYGHIKGLPQGTNLIEDHYRQTVAFIASQLWAVILQCWLMLRFHKTSEGVSPSHINDAELMSRLTEAEVVISNHLPDYQREMKERTGQVARLTMETYAIAKLGKKHGDWGLRRECFSEVKFAAIDEYRFKFFENCWDQAEFLKKQ